MSIFVEHVIRAPLDVVWSHTQDPDQHVRWDLRFTDIDYLPPSSPDEPQRFRYATRLGFGIAVEGGGETIAERNLADGSRTSSLRFWSGQARSLIREGRGYWKYAPTADGGTRFLTSYDYEPRYGLAGRLVDRALFRPVMGWATAWSFDRLRLWLERGIDPGQALRTAAAHGVARLGLATVFAYHGLVPKLLGPDTTEEELMRAAGVPGDLVNAAIAWLGVVEIAFAVVLLLAWHRAWPAYLAIAFGIGALAVTAVTSPASLSAAFNPLTLNAAVIALAAIDRLTLDGIPSAGRCRRRPAPALELASANPNANAPA